MASITLINGIHQSTLNSSLLCKMCKYCNISRAFWMWSSSKSAVENRSSKTKLLQLLNYETLINESSKRLYLCKQTDTNKILKRESSSSSKSSIFNDGVKDEEELFKNDAEIKSILDDFKKDFDVKNTEQPKDADSTVKPKARKSKVEKTQDSQLLNFSKLDSDSKPVELESEFQYDYQVAEDIEEFDYKEESEIAQQQIRPSKVLPISLERGKTGVFDVDELVTFLTHMGAENIVTIPIPKKASFCDNMVIASAKSKRHLNALNEELLWVHKRKKSPNDHHLVIEGFNKTHWCAMDMGNIVLHIFHGDAREFYDIESLWTLGPENDPKCKEQDQDSYILSPEDLFWLETSKTKDNTADGKKSETATPPEGNESPVFKS
ncbi:uncharacterized protein LOC131944408 [Physella acuta]|uniref:uncharacterized protein LOC131944408 n=1 Tax=Physella acuta TaxID=109671 RepID=UPI0027DE6C2D|nr:uncharacterized protein LOC131944408 [Physella acuta]